MNKKEREALMESIKLSEEVLEENLMSINRENRKVLRMKIRKSWNTRMCLEIVQSLVLENQEFGKRIERIKEKLKGEQ